MKLARRLRPVDERIAYMDNPRLEVIAAVKVEKAMRRSTVIALLLTAASFMFASHPVYACEPCLAASFEETVKQADLIIIGQRVDYSPSEKDEQVNGPETIKVSVLQTLKGKADTSIIAVHSWSGMCPYGIVIDDQTYVIFLTKGVERYNAVSVGNKCGVRTYAVKNDNVELGDGVVASIAQFRTKLAAADVNSKPQRGRRRAGKSTKGN